jgi:type II secretory pathway pseudopilin PulG
MLIVIVIIGILAASLIPRIMWLQARARDTKRIHDIRQLSESIYTYWMDNNSYPAKGNTWDWNWAVWYQSNFLSILLPNYIKSVPIDPINKNEPEAFWTLKAWNRHDYYYVYYAYPENSAYNSWCSFAGNEFSVVGAVTIEALKKSVPMVTAFCNEWRSWNDEIDYPYTIQSKWEFY